MNKDTEDSCLQAKVQQLEKEVLRLKRIVREEKDKNKEMEFALSYFQQLYKKEK